MSIDGRLDGDVDVIGEWERKVQRYLLERSADDFATQNRRLGHMTSVLRG